MENYLIHFFSPITKVKALKLNTFAKFVKIYKKIMKFAKINKNKNKYYINKNK